MPDGGVIDSTPGNGAPLVTIVIDEEDCTALLYAILHVSVKVYFARLSKVPEFSARNTLDAVDVTEVTKGVRALLTKLTPESALMDHVA